MSILKQACWCFLLNAKISDTLKLQSHAICHCGWGGVLGVWEDVLEALGTCDHMNIELSVVPQRREGGIQHVITIEYKILPK